MQEALEQAKNSYHNWRRRVPSQELGKFFMDKIYPKLNSNSWKVIRDVHYLMDFPGVSVESPNGTLRRHHPFQFIFDSSKINLEAAIDLLAASMDITNDPRWLKSNDRTVYGIYGEKALLSLGNPDRITGVQRYLHTSLLAEHLYFVNAPICASTSTYVAPNISGAILRSVNATTEFQAGEMERVKEYYLAQRQWRDSVRIDGYEPGNFVSSSRGTICIDPVINES